MAVTAVVTPAVGESRPPGGEVALDVTPTLFRCRLLNFRVCITIASPAFSEGVVAATGVEAAVASENMARLPISGVVASASSSEAKPKVGVVLRPQLELANKLRPVLRTDSRVPAGGHAAFGAVTGMHNADVSGVIISVVSRLSGRGAELKDSGREGADTELGKQAF